MTREYVNSVQLLPLDLTFSFLSYYRRLILTAAPGVQQRFIETFDFFFQSVTQQATDRADGSIPDLESYIALRRDTSGCKPCWALIECMKLAACGFGMSLTIYTRNIHRREQSRHPR